MHDLNFCSDIFVSFPYSLDHFNAKQCMSNIFIFINLPVSHKVLITSMKNLARNQHFHSDIVASFTYIIDHFNAKQYALSKFHADTFVIFFCPCTHNNFKAKHSAGSTFSLYCICLFPIVFVFNKKNIESSTFSF